MISTLGSIQAGGRVFGPDAACLGVIGTLEIAGNFIGACTSIYRVRVKEAGIRVF
ncbi:MAG: hypothetical protein HN720_00475 [Nitrospinaceae bacterium]|nr:hypothetical protein [Nitrospinaceae bacterium]